VSRCDVVTGEIDSHVLMSAAAQAAAHYEDVRAKEEVAYNERVTAYNARSWWHRLWHEPPGGGWSWRDTWDMLIAEERRDRALALIKIGEASRVKNVRLPEKDIWLLRPWLTEGVS